MNENREKESKELIKRANDYKERGKYLGTITAELRQAIAKHDLTNEDVQRIASILSDEIGEDINRSKYKTK